MTKALKPYLARSFGLHACALVAFVFLAPRAMIKKDTVYMIDFVGGPATIAAAAAATPPKQADTAPAPPSQQVDPDSFTKDKRGHVALPRPSLLKGWTEPRESKDKPAEPASAGPSKADAPSSAGSSAGVATDMPNFPYPWYISQV
ncbi:MAG: hypothetical protein HYZ74_06965, partial [Elusimicrobia bacterium]|nr:hypothetical protein [Elusimicrobiota bacterium]